IDEAVDRLERSFAFTRADALLAAALAGRGLDPARRCGLLLRRAKVAEAFADGALVLATLREAVAAARRARDVRREALAVSRLAARLYMIDDRSGELRRAACRAAVLARAARLPAARADAL